MWPHLMAKIYIYIYIHLFRKATFKWSAWHKFPHPPKSENVRPNPRAVLYVRAVFHILYLLSGQTHHFIFLTFDILLLLSQVQQTKAVILLSEGHHLVWNTCGTHLRRLTSDCVCIEAHARPLSDVKVRNWPHPYSTIKALLPSLSLSKLSIFLYLDAMYCTTGD